MRSTVDVLGVNICRLDTTEVIYDLRRRMCDTRSHAVYLVNAATLNLAYADQQYRACLNRGDLVLNDGTGVRWAARWSGERLHHNHVGTDLIPNLLGACSDRVSTVFLLGGRPGVADSAGQVLQQRFPWVRIVGTHHGFLTAQDDVRITTLLNHLRPALVLVAMGNPLQELWIDRNQSRVVGGALIGVGGLFDHLAGNLRRAPLCMRRLGCEWVQILWQQPHKWRRYLLGNPLFLWRMVGRGPRT